MHKKISFSFIMLLSFLMMSPVELVIRNFPDYISYTR